MKKTNVFILFILLFSIDSFLAQDILPPINKWTGKSESLIVSKNHPWVSPSELSNLTETPNYSTTINWLEKLCNASPSLSLITIGTSEQGRAIKMVVASKEKQIDATNISASNNACILIQAGIHSGEIDGKDAGMMLLRDIAFGGKEYLLDGVNILFVPVLNVDGHERMSEFGRVNQRGPKSMGWRTNAQNLNLNRDYTKLETSGIKSIINVINNYNPDLYIDLHVTDGADYQYDITYGFMENAYSPEISIWLSKFLREEVDIALFSNGHTPGNFMNPLNGRDFENGNADYSLSPRFSNAYGDLRHLPTILVENHSLKTYKQRVLGTYIFLEQCIKSTNKHFAELKKAIEIDKKQTKDSLILEFGMNNHYKDSFQLKGIASEIYKSKITGSNYVKWTGKKINQIIPNYKMNMPMATIKLPKAYWIPVEWNTLIEKIKAHGIAVETIDKEVEVIVEQDFIAEYQLEKAPFEGMLRFESCKVEPKKRTVIYYPGSIKISTNQPLGELAAILLESQSIDGFFQWGYMHSVLARTEYIEAYVLEPMAEKMLTENPSLKKEFDEKMKNDATFASSPQNIYQWFYSHSPYFDSEWKIIPIGKEW